MFVVKSQSKGSILYYLAKTIKDEKTGNYTSAIVEKIGSQEEVLNKILDETKSKQISDKTINKWLKTYAKKKTDEYNQNKADINLIMSPTQQLMKNNRQLYNAGYLVLQKICYKLEINKICQYIQKKEKLNFDLGKVFLYEIYNKLIKIDNDISTQDFALSLIENQKFTTSQINKALEVLSKYSSYIQKEVFVNSFKFIKRDLSIVFSNCMNYFFYVYPKNKNSKRNYNYIIQTEVLLDKNGLPIAYINNSDKDMHKEIYDSISMQSKYMSDYIKFISFSDSYPSINLIDQMKTCKDKQIFNIMNAKSLSPAQQDWILNKDGWKSRKPHETYNLKKVEEAINRRSCPLLRKNSLTSTPFYKTCKFKDNNGKEKFLLVYFSYLNRDWSRKQRNNKLQNISSLISENVSKSFYSYKKAPTDVLSRYKNYINEFSDESDTSSSKTITENQILVMYDIKEDLISAEETFDGYICLISDKPIDQEMYIVDYRATKWIKEDLFKNMQLELISPKTQLSKEVLINAHLLNSFIALLISTILETDFKNKYYALDIITAVRNMNFLHIKNRGWIPVYEANQITQNLAKIYGIDLDYDIVTEKMMDLVVKQTKNN